MQFRIQAAGNHIKTNVNTAWAGRVVARHTERGLHRIAYDDGTCEIVHLGVISYETLSGGPPAVFASATPTKQASDTHNPSTNQNKYNNLLDPSIPTALGLYTQKEIEGEGEGEGWEDLQDSKWRILVKWTRREQRLQAGGGYKVTGPRSVGLMWTGRVVAKHTHSAAAGVSSGVVHRIAYDDGAVEIADLAVVAYQTLSGGPPPRFPPAPCNVTHAFRGSGGHYFFYKPEK